MIRTGAEFYSENKKLNTLYERAHGILMDSLKPFGDRKLVTEDPESKTISLLWGVLGAQTLSYYDISAALDSVMSFFVSRRADGRLASSLEARGEYVIPKYEKLAGFCFVAEAMDLFYLSKRKELAYLERLYRVLSEFDAYLWAHHDLNEDGCLTLLSAADAEEEGSIGRFTSLKLMQAGAVHTVSPFPIEAVDLMAEAYAIRATLAECAAILGNGEEALWAEKADAVKKTIREKFWFDSVGALFDRDYRGGVIDNLTVNNLSLLYYGAADEDMAKKLMTDHILNTKEFWGKMPLPTVAMNGKSFANEKISSFNGPARSLTYLRAIRAFENYGYYSALTELGKRFLSAVSESGTFPVQFDPMTGEPTGLEKGTAYMPAASAVLEFIKRFYGIYVAKDTLCFGALGTDSDESMEYRFTWGSDEYRLVSEKETVSAYVSDKHLFTVTCGTRVFTDGFGTSPRVANVTGEVLDCIFVYRNRTYSFTLAPDEVWQEQETHKKGN